MNIRFFTIAILSFLLLFFGLQTVLAAPASQFQVEIISVFACSDGVDNDGDSLIDFPNDPGCDSITDTDEFNAPPAGGGGGVGGPGPRDTSITNVVISGQGYPNQQVTLLKDSQIVSTIPANALGKFTIDVKDLSAGNYVFSLYSQDINTVRSTLVTFPTEITKDALTNITGAFIPPTIRSDKLIVAKGKLLSLAGQTAPNAIVELILKTPDNRELSVTANSNTQGIYTYQLDTTPLAVGKYSVHSRTTHEGRVSTYSTTITFDIGNDDTLNTTDDGCAFYADLNGDCRVNLIDFSISAFWYEQELSAEFEPKESERLNGDNQINLTDFSIMAFYWTG